MRLKIISFKRGEKSLTKCLFRKILVVMVLAAFIVSLTQFTNSIFINDFFNGNNGAGMAAMSLSLTSISVIDIFCSIITTGTQAKSAGAMAKINKLRANEYVSAGIVLGAIVGVAFFFVGFFTAFNVAEILADGQSEEIERLTEQILKGFYIGVPFYVMNAILRPIEVLDGDRKLVFISLISIIVVNICGNLINCYCVHGGAFGVSFSTSIAYIVSTGILFIHFYRKKTFLKFRFKHFHIKIAIELAHRGCINITKTLSIFLLQLYANFMLLRTGGLIALTILGIQSNCFSIVNSLVNGVYDCGFMLNHVFSAEEDDKAVYDLSSLLFRFVILFVATISIVCVFIAPIIADGYQISDPNEFNQLVLAIRCSIAIVPFMAIQTIGIVFMPLFRCHIALALQILIFPVIFSLIFISFMGVNGYWIGAAIGNCFYIIVHLILCIIKYKRWPHTMIELYFMPEDFGYDPKKTLRYRIENHRDCDFLYRECIVMCKTLNIDKKRSDNLANAIKAIGKIYDLTKIYDSKDHFAEAVVYYKKGELGMRLRDNSDFDFKKDIRNKTDNSIELNKALATIIMSFSDVNYINVLNISNVAGVI